MNLTHQPPSLRVLLANIHPRMLSDIVADTISAQPDMAVVAHLPTLNRIQEVAKNHDVNVVVLGMTNCVIPRACWSLMTLKPGVKVFGIAKRGRRPVLGEFQELGKLEPASIAMTIRKSAHV